MNESYKGYKIEIERDQFGSNPADDGNYSIVTFNRGGYASNAKITDVPMNDDEQWPEMAEEVAEGQAFPILYTEHGNCNYSLAYPKDPKPDGFIILEPEYAANHDDVEDRRDMAKSDLEQYTQWANGEVYFVQVRDPYGDLVADDGEGMGDIIGYEYALQFGKQVVDSDGINYATKAKRAQELHR